jgi:hypothetical protein
MDVYSWSYRSAGITTHMIWLHMSKRRIKSISFQNRIPYCNLCGCICETCFKILRSVNENVLWRNTCRKYLSMTSCCFGVLFSRVSRCNRIFKSALFDVTDVVKMTVLLRRDVWSYKQEYPFFVRCMVSFLCQNHCTQQLELSWSRKA